MTEQTAFELHDANEPLPFPDESFDAIISIDAINHLPDRRSVLADWTRLLRPGGRLLFIDPIVVTGPLSNAEIAIRSMTGFFLFVPKGTDERLIEDAGLDLLDCEDRTSDMADMAERWRAARAARCDALLKIEGQETFHGTQEFFRVAELLAREHRLSRFVFVAQKPA